MADDTADETTQDGSSTGARHAARDARRANRLAKEIGAFAKAHGGAEGQIAHLGQRGARIVLVGADGGWGTWSHRPTRSPSRR